MSRGADNDAVHNGDKDSREEFTYTIDIDIGGTFTDGYIVGAGRSIRVKTDTTPHNFAVGVLDCVRAAAEMLAVEPDELLLSTDVIRLSTTVATNTLINRNGARVGLLVGAALHKDHGEQLSPRMPLEPAMLEVIPDEPSTDHAGAVLAAVRRLLERGARVLVVALTGHELSARESALRDLIARDFPRHYLGAVPVLRSSEITLAGDPVVRVHTAVLNAYVHPVMAGFLYRVEDELRRMGYRRPLLSANADGGTSRVAKTTAIRTWGSGPAAGVAAARALAKALDLAHVITLDVGGTSCDISTVRDVGIPKTVRPRLDDVEVSLPTVRITSVGIGGGSVATVTDGRVRVGPESMSGVPGPAAFGLGGDRATLTDAACCLGVFDPMTFFGGRKRLDLRRAYEVVESEVAKPLGIEVGAAALRILNAAADEIASHVTAMIAEAGVAPADLVLFAFGGNGGLLGHSVAGRLGVRRSYAFPLNPVLSAFGLSGLDLMHAYEALVDGEEVRHTVEGLKRRAERDMRGEGVDTRQLSFHVEAEGTTSTGVVSVVELADMADPVAAWRAATETADSVELLRMRAVAPGRGYSIPNTAGDKPATIGSRDVVWESGQAQTTVFDWTSLPAETVIDGPALLETDQTTVLVPPGSQIKIGSFGEAVFQVAAGVLGAGPSGAAETRHEGNR